MDGATAGLIGVVVGSALSATAALLTPWVNARLARTEFKREVEQAKLASLESVLDDAALALEAVHWALREALRFQSRHARSGSAYDRPEWGKICAQMASAQAEVSRHGTRLALRLGTPRGGLHSPCVAAYDVIQHRYRALVREVSTSRGDLDIDALEKRLDGVGDHHTYLNEAAALLKPKAL